MWCITVTFVLENRTLVTNPFFAQSEIAAKVLKQAFTVAWNVATNGFPEVRHVSEPFRLTAPFTL